jgi:hypothetical protein
VSVGLRPGRPPTPRREVHYRLIDGVAEILTAADRVLAVAGETVGACPRYGAGIPTKQSA